MSAEIRKVIERMEASGFSLEADGDGLLVEPASLLSPLQIEWLRGNKAAIVAELAATPPRTPPAETGGSFWRGLLAEVWDWNPATTPQGSGWLWGVHLQNKHDPELWPTPDGAAWSYTQAAPELQRAFAGRQVRAVYLAQTGSR